jgi:serine/threonine-protein kinase
MAGAPFERIDSYRIVRCLGKGGMGEVYLALDEAYGREVALKRVRPDLLQRTAIQERFLREARIAAQLSHPAIIPIYTIREGPEGIYYTMPCVEGETLKTILRLTREQEKRGEPLHSIGSSIPALIRIFLTVCQAIAYAHSKRVLHRDLKPENIIVGTFGEVLLLDWGLAECVGHPSEGWEEAEEEAEELTLPGKIVGTLTHMAPERALGEPASFLTDVYALGVILYQILTLRLPFLRRTLKEFRKHLEHERVIDPVEAAPYRDIPRQLAAIALKCLSPQRELRYQSVESLIADLESYSEGRPEWLEAAVLSTERSTDWEFQENVLLAKHVAITRGTTVMEWVSLMISRAPFMGNTKIETRIRLGPKGEGVGVVLALPEAKKRRGLIEEGYCLWMEAEALKLFHAKVEVMHIEDAGLGVAAWRQVRIEKTSHHIRLFLDGALRLNYISHTPLTGAHVGFLYKDADFDMEALQISTGSQNVTVSCLAVPDAFLANKDYAKAIEEYRRIAQSFPGRAEGREGTFRAGIALLEQGLAERTKRRRELFLSQALEEFDTLRATPGGPLEYLGKSLVYHALDDIEEESKCLELALRKYSKHPLLPALAEHCVFRLHESAYKSRQEAYYMTLLALRHLPCIFSNPDNQKLLDSLTTHWEPLPFIEPSPGLPLLAVQLAFWLAKPLTLTELIATHTDDSPLVENALYALLELGCWRLAKEQDTTGRIALPLLLHETSWEAALDRFFAAAPSQLDFCATRALAYIAARAPSAAYARLRTVSSAHRLLLDAACLYALLKDGRLSEAKALFAAYPQEQLAHERSPLYFLWGCYLAAVKGEKSALAHFASASDIPFPPTTALIAAYLRKGRAPPALFFWERLQLYRALHLFYQCAGAFKRARFYRSKFLKEADLSGRF